MTRPARTSKTWGEDMQVSNVHGDLLPSMKNKLGAKGLLEDGQRMPLAGELVEVSRLGLRRAVTTPSAE